MYKTGKYTYEFHKFIGSDTFRVTVEDSSDYNAQINARNIAASVQGVNPATLNFVAFEDMENTGVWSTLYTIEQQIREINERGKRVTFS